MCTLMMVGRARSEERVGHSVLKMSHFECPLVAPIFPTIWQTQLFLVALCRLGTSTVSLLIT